MNTIRQSLLVAKGNVHQAANLSDELTPVVDYYPVDLPLDYHTLRISAENFLSCLEFNSIRENYFLLPSGEKMTVTQDSVCQLPLFSDDDLACVVLALHLPEDQTHVLALYLAGRWWALNDILKTSNSSRSGLMLVQSAEERLVLFVLSQIIFGTLERPISETIYFSPHPVKETGKIIWVSGEAVGFYTIKEKGRLCDRYTAQCYLLPVLDTVFVRSSWRRQGFALRMLGDFCSSFSNERVVGISYPVSADMYQVCRKYLSTHDAEQERLYEVEAPGDWSQRRNVWLTLQLGCNP
ncbi:protein FAM169B isoform X2 [Paramormyrops kingsleyae]|uniref:protein FAM169B isoform X2 n=1 Tax=Paramormyrops kingsleyae TaxID=1676925 RepID=UPI003B978DD4